MKTELIKNLLILLFVGIIIYILYKKLIPKERFQDSMKELVQDRTNPLASQQHPLTNPAANIGISEASGSSLRNLAMAALNIPMQIPSNGAGSFNTKDNVNPSSMRIDNENSMLGLVKFCKETGSASDNPFNNPKFASNCGMCMSSGSLITGETFNTPTGVLVYEQDKDRFYKRKIDKSYRFARAIPSVKSAVCQGATMDNDSAVPVLAIDNKMYLDINARNICKKQQSYGNNCGQCLNNTNVWSYVKVPPKHTNDNITNENGGIYDIQLYFYGNGYLSLSIAGNSFGTSYSLNSKATIINISALARVENINIQENTNFQIKIIPDNSGSMPTMYGALMSTLPNGHPFFIKIDETITSNYRSLNPVLFSDINLTLASIVPFPGQTSLIMDCIVPLTFVQPDQIASYDCPAGPFITSQNDAQMLTDDPCSRPMGQGPDNYSQQCIQSKLFASGCSTSGDWYKNGLPASATVGKTIGDIATWISNMVSNGNDTQVDVSKGCYGVDISTPCDSFIGNDQIPNQQCMSYLYSNTSGKSYPNAGNSYLSLNKKTPQFCQPAGTLNPNTPNGLYELQKIAAGYNGYTGADAVKWYLSQVFLTAIGNLSMNKEDSNGGRLTSWTKCFGVPIDTPPREPQIIPQGSGQLKIAPAGSVQLSGSSTIYFQDDGQFPRVVRGKIYLRGPAIPDGTYTDHWEFLSSQNGVNNILSVSLSNGVNLGIPDGTCFITNSCNPYNYTYAYSRNKDFSMNTTQILCTPATGNKVSSLLEVKTRAGSPWYGSSYGWEDSAPNPGNGIMWIWATPNANITAPGLITYIFEYNYCNTQDIQSASVDIAIDNSGSVIVNNIQVAKGEGPLKTTKIRLIPGVNNIKVIGENFEQGPAGFWLVLKDPNTNEILCKTDSTWVWNNMPVDTQAANQPLPNNGCGTLGTPGVLNNSAIRLYTKIDCDKLGGTWHADGQCTKVQGGSWSFDCRVLNPIEENKKEEREIHLEGKRVKIRDGKDIIRKAQPKCDTMTLIPNQNFSEVICPPGSSDAVGRGRCHVGTLSEAQGICSANPNCSGITKDNGGYEPRSGTLAPWSGMTSWSCSQ